MENTIEQEAQYLRQIFDRYDADKDGNLNAEEFGKLVNVFVKKMGDNKPVDLIIIKAGHTYYDTHSRGVLSFMDVYEWWSYSDRFKLFTGEPARLLHKGYQLFCAYARGKGGQMTFNDFERLLEDKKIAHKESTFDGIDRNDDGLVSFREFFDWLHWV